MSTRLVGSRFPGLAGLAGLALFTCGLSGCAAGPSDGPQTGVTLGPGPAPTQAEAEAIGRAWLERRKIMNESQASTLRWSPISQGSAERSLWDGGGAIAGFKLLGQVDLPRPEDGVTITREYQVLIRDGKVVAAWGHRDVESGCCSNPYMKRFE